MGPLPPEIAAELENLRDIRMPDDIAWWPLAPGWWALLAIVCLAGLALMFAISRRRRTLRYRALRELDRLGAERDMDPVTLAERIEVLLKRIVLQKADDRALAAAHGEPWVTRLTRGDGAMAPEVARFVAEAPYIAGTPSPDAPDNDTLVAAAERWIRRNA